MEDSALSVDVEHDLLPEFNRMLPLPNGPEDRYDEEDFRLARGTRLRVWRSGPADGQTLRAAAEAEVAGEIEQGQVAEDDRMFRIDNIVDLLSDDVSIADPPDADEVALSLERGREEFTKWHRPYLAELDGKRSPVPEPDRYGNWPGVFWRQAVEHTLRTVSRLTPPREGRDELGRRRSLPPTTSDKIATLWLRREKMDEAEAVAAREAAERSKRSDLAVASLPVVFEGDQQKFLSFLRRLHAGGDFGDVPTDGNPVAEAELLRQVRAHDIFDMTPAEQAEVASELMRVVAMAETAVERPLIVPGLGYAIKVAGKQVVDVFPGNLTLTIKGREHVLNSPELPRPVRLSAKEYRDPRLSAITIYEQTLVEVDLPRGHWRKWWPVLAERLRKTARIVEDGERGLEWGRFRSGVIAGAVESAAALPDGAPYRCSRGVFVGKEWLADKAVEAGVISAADRRAFLAWLGEAKPEADDTGRRHKRLRLAGPLCIEGTFEPVEKIAVLGTEGTNVPKNKGETAVPL